MTDLLPCPFCGGEAARVDIEDGENAGGSCVCCKKCNASGNLEFEFKENFITAWNTRTPTPAPNAAAVNFSPMETAPKDGTMLRLLVDYSGDGANPLEDATQAWTIGFNNLADTEDDVWQFAGWSWEQDCFTEGHGEVIGWLPLHTIPAAETTPDPRDEVIALLVEAAKALVSFASINICDHSQTHRGGFIWEICDDCGAKWADDQGGKPEYLEPAEFANMRAALAAAKEVMK